MTKVIKEFSELSTAIKDKNNDINSIVWKEKYGKEVRLVDMDYNQLQKAYNHTMSMLYNENRFTPGKFKVKKNIKSYITQCNAELMKRYLLYECEIDTMRNPLDLIRFINDFKRANSLPGDATVDTMFNHLPKEFSTVTFNDLVSACLDQCDTINRKMISTNFILSQGIWLTDKEKEELKEVDENGKQRPWLEVIKERLVMPQINLRVDTKGFSFSEFRALLHLAPNAKISSLPSDTLRLFRDKVFLLLDVDVDYHIKKWETIKDNIEKVAEIKNYTLTVPEFS